MAQIHPKLDTDTFIYWLKLGLAIQYTKQAVEPFVIEETDRFREEILKDVYTQNGVSRGTTCTSCRIENVIPCRTSDFCTRGKGVPCKLHALPEHQNRLCPNNVCNTFVRKIRDEHRFFKPSWKNCNAIRWCTESVEIAKCFMSKEGYADVTCFDDVDFNGVLNVMINCKRFQNKFTNDLSKTKNIVTEARDVGKAFRHCPNLGLTMKEFMRYIDFLVVFLSDITDPSDASWYLHQKKIDDAVVMLKQLKTETLTVKSSDAAKVIENFLREGMQKMSAHSDRLKTRMQEEHRSFITNVLHAAKSVINLTSDSLKEINLAKSSVIDDIKEEARNQMKSLDKEGKRLKRKHTQSFTRETKKMKLSFKKEREKALAASRKNDERISESEEYPKLKGLLQDDMLELYRKQHINVPVSPIREENEVPLLKNYVSPTLKCKEYEKGPYTNQIIDKSKPVLTYHAIFYNGSVECKDVYLSAPAGTGKTCFVKRMALAWCQSRSPVEDHNVHFTDEELETIKTFDFVFLLSIREVSQQECDVDEMIWEQVISQLSLAYLFNNDLLQEVLHNEKCLILIDGLDEWTNGNSRSQTMSILPRRKVRKKCTILTTARPWKIAAIIENRNFIDQHIELSGLEEQSANELITNALANLNARYHDNKSPEDFVNLLKQNRVHKLMSIPLILLQLLCLWFADDRIGDSRCEIYSNMLEFLFSHAKKRRSHPVTRSKLLKNLKSGISTSDLPKCFSECHACHTHRNVVIGLGKLAFDGLFSVHFGSSLLFNKTVVEGYLSQGMLRLCMEIGILTQNNAHRKLKQSEPNYSFIHKTYQEYLAALYISLNPSDVVQQILDFCTSAENILQVSNIFIFASGMNEDVAISFWRRFQEIISNDIDTKAYRRNIGTLFIRSRHKMQRLHSAMISCLLESYDNGFKQTSPIAQDIFINSKCKIDWLLEKSLIDRNMHNIRSLDIQTIKVEQQVHEMFHSLDVHSLDRLEKMYIWGSLPTQDIAIAIRSSFESLLCLELWHLTFTDDLLNAVSQLQHLEGLSLLSVNISHRQIESLMGLLTNIKTLRQLSLNELKCLDHCQFCEGYRLNLVNSRRLEMLCLDKLHVIEINVNAHALNMCVVDWMHKGGALATLLDSLKHAPNLERFECDGVDSDKDLDKVAEVLTTCTRVKYVRLRNINLGDRTLQLSGCESLECIYMWHVNINTLSLQNLITKIKAEQKSVTVMIEDCEIKPAEDFAKLKQLMHEWKEFEVMISDRNVRDKEYFHFKTNV